MVYYDIELIDINENVENFKFQKLNKKDLDKIILNFKEDKPYIEFTSLEGSVVMKTQHIRGVMYQTYEEKEKTVLEENVESAKEITKVILKKTVYNSTGEIV